MSDKDSKTISYLKTKKLDSYSFFAFIGTAVGAGVIFSPVIAGRNGFVVTIVSFVLAFYVVYYAQKYFSIILLKAENCLNYKQAMQSFLGVRAGLIISLFFIFQLIVTLLIYAKGVIQCLRSFLPLNVTSFETSIIITFCATLVMLLFILCSEEKILKILKELTILLLSILLVVSVLMIPVWRFDSAILTHHLSITGFIKGFFKCFPLFIGIGVFFVIISPIVFMYREKYPDLEQNTLMRKILSINQSSILTMSIVICIFLISASLTLTIKGIDHTYKFNLSSLITFLPNGIYYGENHSLPALSLIGVEHTPTILTFIISLLDSILILLAIITSFLGVMLSLIHMLLAVIPFPKSWLQRQKRYTTVLVSLCFIWVFTIFNFSVIDLVSYVCNLCNGIILFIIPAFIIFYKRELADYRRPTTYIVILTGIISAFAYIIVRFIH